MSCDSHSLGDIPGENSNIITLQSILVPSTNIDDVDTDELAWGFDSILPVHTTEEELRGLAHVAVTDHAYAIPAAREPRDCSSPLMTSRSVQTPFEQSDDDQISQPGQEIACSDPDAAATIAALVAGVPGVPEDTFTTYSIYVQNNDQTIHNVTEAMLSSLQRQQRELEEDDEEPPSPSPPEPEPPKKEISPAVTPTNIRRSTRISGAEQRELAEKSRQEDSQKEVDPSSLFKKPTDTVEPVAAGGLAPMHTTPTVNNDPLNKTPDLVAASTDNQGNITCFLQPSSTSTPVKQSDGEPETPPSSGRGRGRGQRGRGRGAQKGEPSPVTPGAGRGNAGRSGAKAASRGRGATPTGRGRGRGRGGSSSTPGRKKKEKDTTETEESDSSIQTTDQSITDVSVSEPAAPAVVADTLLAGRPKRRQIKNRKYEKDTEPEKPKAKRAGPGRPRKKKEEPATPKGVSELDTSKESVNSTPLKTKVGRGGKRMLAKSAASQLSMTADISEAVSATDVSMNADLSNEGQVSLVSHAADTSIEDAKQADISDAARLLEESRTILQSALDKSDVANSSKLENNLADTSNSLLESNKQSLDDSQLVGSKLDDSQLIGSKLDDSQLDGSKLDNSQLDESKLDNSQMDGSKVDNSMLDGSKLDDSKLDSSNFDGSKLDNSQLDDSKIDSQFEDSQFDDSKLDESKLDDSKLDTTSSEESLLLSSLIKKPKGAPKKAATTIKKSGRGGRQGPAGVGRGKKKKAGAVPVSEGDDSGMSPDVSVPPKVGKKKKVKVKVKEAVEGVKKKKKKELVVEKKKKKKKKKGEVEEKNKDEQDDEEEEEEEEEEDNNGEVATKTVPLMKTGRPKRQARIRKEEREKEAKATEQAAKKKLKKRAATDSDDEYDEDDDDDEYDDAEDDDVEDDDEEEVPLQRLKKQQSSTKGKKANNSESATPPPAKKTPKSAKKVSALQIKVHQVEKELQEEERRRQAADEKARAEAKIRAEKEARKLRKIRKSKESLDKTMTELFIPDGMIVHEAGSLGKKDTESEGQVDHTSQTLSEKPSGGHVSKSSEILASKPLTLSEAPIKATLPSSSSKTAISAVQSPKVASGLSMPKASSTPKAAKTPKSASGMTTPKAGATTLKAAASVTTPKVASGVTTSKSATGVTSQKVASGETVSTAASATSVMTAKTVSGVTTSKAAAGVTMLKAGTTPKATPVVTSKAEVTVGVTKPESTAGVTNQKATIIAPSPKSILSKMDDQSVIPTAGLAKTPISAVPFPKTSPPKTSSSPVVNTALSSGENIVATSTTAIITGQKVTTPVVMANSDGSDIQSSPIVMGDKTVSPLSATKAAPSQADRSPVSKKIPPFSLKERNYSKAEKKLQRTIRGERVPVRMEAQTTMTNEKTLTSVSVSIGCQADEDSEYEYASCTEEADDDSQLEGKSRGKACSICSMVQDNQYLVICDICKKSFHGHCAELTLEDMQRILQDGEKFVCDNCPIDGASGAAVSTTDAQKEEDTPNAGTTNATAPVEVPAVHSTDQSSEEASLTPVKRTKEKKQRSEEEVGSSPAKKSVKEVVSNSTSVAATPSKRPSSDGKKESLPISSRETIAKKDTLPASVPKPATTTPKKSSEAKPLRKSSKDRDSNKEKGEKDKGKVRLKSSSKEPKRKDSGEQRSSKESKDRKNSKERTESSSHREKKPSSSKDKKESLNRDKHRVSTKDKRESKEKDLTSTTPTTKTFGSLAPRKPEVSSAQVSSSTGQTNESEKKPLSDKIKKKKLLHFKDMDLKKRTFQQCIGAGCKSDARQGSVYCSDDCIVRHAQESLALLKNERQWQQTGQKPTEKPVLQQAPPPPPPPPPPPQQQQVVQQLQQNQQLAQQEKPQQEKPQQQQQTPQPQQQPQQQQQQPKKDSSINNSKVVVLERKSGRILTGPTAPTESGLKEWLTEHPTFEVLQPSLAAIKPSSFFGKDKDKPRTVNSERKPSTEQKKKEPPDMKASGQSVKGPDDVRHNVRKSLHEALANRAREAENIKRISNTELKQLVFSIEAELYKLYNDSGHKYKARYRSLIFNIKDTNNKGLFRKILARRIKPHRLVRLTADELASAELAQWRQKEAKHTLELIEQREVEAIKEAAKGHVVKKTHKGEIDVAGEDLSTLEAKPVAALKPARIDPKVDIIGGIMNDTTESHQTHLFDLNCKICTGKMAPPSEEPPAKKSKKDVSSSGKSDPKKKSSKSSTPKSEKPSSKSSSKTTSKSKAELLKEEEVKNVIESIRAVTQQVEAQVNEIRASPDSPLPSAMKTSNSRNVTVRSPDSVLQSGLEKKVKFSPSSPLVWKGFIHMQDLVKFMTTAYRMSGPTEHLELQDTIHVCGRIAPELIWDYLTRIKQTGSRDICVLRFLPGSFDEKNAYVTLYSYLNSRGRCGVVGNNSRHIKDMYIVPLASHSKIPPLLLPFDEPGLEDNRPHMLLGVIVRQKVTKRPVEPLSSGSQASVTTDNNDIQVKRLKYDPMLPSTTIKLDSSASQLPAKYDPTQPATLPPKYPPAAHTDLATADTQPTSSAVLPELKDKYYNTPAALKEVPYTPSPVVNVKSERFKQPSPSPVDSSTSDSPDTIGSRINDPIVKAFGKMDAISESVNTTPVEDLSAAPYSPTQYDPAPVSLLSDNVSTSSSSNNTNTNSNNNNNVVLSNDDDDDADDNDYAMQDDEKPYDPEECDFEESEDSPPPPPPPPPPPATSASTAVSSSQIPPGIGIVTPTSPKSAVSMAQIFDQIKMSSFSPGVTAVISAVSGKPETKDLLAELTQRVGEKKTDAPLPKPSTANLPTALQNLFSQVSKVSMTPSLSTNLGTGLTPASTTSTALPLNLPTTNVLTTTQSSNLGSIQLPPTSTGASSNQLPNSSFTGNTSASQMTTNAKDITTTESSGLSQSLTIPVVKKDQALSSLMPGSTLPPISETGWSTIAQTLASLAKVQTSNLPTQVPSAAVTTTLITKNTGSAIYTPSTTTTSADFKHIILPESHKTIPNIPPKDVTALPTSLADSKKTKTFSVSKPPDAGKVSSVRIAFASGPKHPLVPHAAFKEEEKPKMHSLLSETKIPGLGVEEEEEEEEMRTTEAKDNAFLTRAKFDALSTIAKTDSFLAGGLRSDSFISNWKGINVGNKSDGLQIKVEDSKALYEASKSSAESQQQVAALKAQSESQSQIESSRSRSETHYESSSSSSSTKTKPETTSSKDLGKGRSDSRYESSSAKIKESHHDPKSRSSHESSSKDSRRRSESDRKRSSSSSGHHSDTGTSSKSGRYSERSDRHSHSRHSKGRDYPDKRDRDYRKDYGGSDHRSKDRDHERDRDRDRDYDHGSSKSKERGSERKERRRSSSSKSEDQSVGKKGSEKSDKFGSMSNEDSNKYGDVDERKVYGASSSYIDSANRYTADKKDIPMSSTHDGSKSYKSSSVKKDGDDSFRSLPFPRQDQDLRKGLSHNVAPPASGVPPAPQPIPTLTSSSLEEFPSDVDHRKHGLSWPAIFDHKSKDKSENDSSAPTDSLWAGRGDIDYRSQSNPVGGPRILPPQPTHNTGGAIPGWANTASAPQHMTSTQASFQSISTVLNQRPGTGKAPVEPGNPTDQDMRKLPTGPQKIEVILPRPTAKDFFGTADSESSDSMSQSPSRFETEPTRQRIPGTFIAPSGNPNESQNNLRVVLPSWNNAVGQDKLAPNAPAPSTTAAGLTPASIQTSRDVDDRQNIYRKVGLPPPPPPPAGAPNPNLLVDVANSSSKVMKISPVDSAHSRDPQLAAPDVSFYSAAPPPPPPHSSHLEHIATSTTVISSASPQETRPVKSVAPTPPSAAPAGLLPVITQVLPSPGLPSKKALPTYGTSNLPPASRHPPPHSEFVPSTSHIQPVVDIAASQRLQTNPQNIPMPDHNPQPPPPPPPPPPPQHDPQKKINSSSNPLSHNLVPSWPSQQDSSSGQAPILSPNEYYEHKTYADSSTASSSDTTLSSSPSSSVAGVSMDPHLGAPPPPPLSSIRPPPPIGGPPPPPPPFPGSGPQLHRGGQFLGPHPQSGHGYHLPSRTDYHQGEEGPRTFGGPRHPFRTPGPNFQGPRMDRGSGGGASGHFPHQRQGSRFN